MPSAAACTGARAPTGATGAGGALLAAKVACWSSISLQGPVCSAGESHCSPRACFSHVRVLAQEKQR